MSGNTSNEEEKARSFVHAEFTDVGSAQFDLKLENATAQQLIAVASYLEVYAKTFFSGQIARSLQKRADKELAVPKPEIEIAK